MRLSIQPIRHPARCRCPVAPGQPLSPPKPQRPLRLGRAAAPPKLAAHKPAKRLRADALDAGLLGIALHQPPGARAAHGLGRGPAAAPAVKAREDVAARKRPPLKPRLDACVRLAR